MYNQHSLFISVIIPCFNEEQVIAQTYKRIKATMKSFEPTGYEMIFVNDGSKDNTYNILSAIAQTDNYLKIIDFSRNFGHQAAVTAGVRICKGDVALIIDADLQDPPELIHDMLALHLSEGANVVYGQRMVRKGETWFKKKTAHLFYRLLNYLSDTEFPVDTGDFRLIDKKVIIAFSSITEKNKYIRGLISWIGFKQLPLKYVREERFAGETKYPFSKMIKFASTSLLYFSKKPLKIALTIGFICVFIGILLTIWVITALLFRKDTVVAGWASTVIVVIFFGGIQLLTIGVLGEYIGNVFEEVKNRPEYIINNKINF